MISYKCSLMSNSESVHLIWRVISPNLTSVNITYDINSTAHIKDYLPLNIYTILTKYERDQCIESVLVLTIMKYENLNGTQIECAITDLDQMSETVRVQTGGKLLEQWHIIGHCRSLILLYLFVAPLPPTGINITREIFSEIDITILLEWDRINGSIPEDIVDRYIISVTPKPRFQPINNVVFLSHWYTVMAYNVIYNLSISFANCAGESAPYIIIFEYGSS